MHHYALPYILLFSLLAHSPIPTQAIPVMPQPPPPPSTPQTPFIRLDTAKHIFKRQRDCSQINCPNLGAGVPVPRPECRWFSCGLCAPEGICLPDPGQSDSYDPKKPGNPFGGAGGATNGAGSGDSANTCNADLQDSAGSCPGENNTGGGGGGSGSAGNNQVAAAASCSGKCSTGNNGACGSGCACAFAGTGMFGGPDGSCIKLVSFAGSG